MKKRLALLLGVMLTLIALFASCGQATPTDRRPRWADKETYEFKITLPDLESNYSETALFKSYSKTINKTGDDGKVTTTTLTCHKDDVVSAGEAYILLNSDQLRPADVNGKYVLTIQEATTTWKAETSQVIYSQYEKAVLQELGCLEAFEKSPLNVTAKEENPFENNEGRITLKSVTTSSVVFANDENQAPVSSLTENKGFYIGKTAQQESTYKYETTYDIANKKAIVKENDGEAQERKLSLGNGAKCIDASQLLLYVRSLDKSDNAFQSAPSVYVYDVTTDSMSTVSFALERQFNLKIDNADLTETIVTLNAVNVTVGGVPFLAQYNLPDLTGKGEGYDYLPISGDKRCKYTTVKFRCGWYSYELQLNEQLKQTLKAIEIK